MVRNAEPTQSVVVSDGSVDLEAGAASRFGRAASPVIIGLAAPILLMLIIDPSALKHARFLVVAVLMPMLFVAIGLYVYSVLDPGDVRGVVADIANRRLDVIQSNYFATRKTVVPFADIAGAKLVHGYDPDGYPMSVAEVVLVNGDRFALPPETTEADMKDLRAALRLK